MNFTTFPQLTTERTTLRQLEKSDNRAILFLRSDEVVNKYVRRPRAESLAEADAFIDKIKTFVSNNESVYWCIALKETNEMIGSISLWKFSEDKKVAEVGYDLHPKFHGKGIMNEALCCVLNFGFTELQLDKIEACTHKENQASKKLLLKNKFCLMENREDKENSDGAIFEIERKSYTNT